ncbi:sensor histidine kinase [Metabacillus sp. HB246100]
MKWFKSLQVKYLLIVFLAMAIIPISIPIISLVVYVPATYIEGTTKNHPYTSYKELEEEWHKEATTLSEENENEVKTRLQELHNKYTDSQIFWVDKFGVTRDNFGYNGSLPQKWTSSYTVQFMKESIDSDPYTVVAFFNEDSTNGFMVIKVDRQLLDPPIQRLSNHYGTITLVVIALILVFFVILSWLFFRSIHKRLLRLSNAMQMKDNQNIPKSITITRDDEIGQLEESFNQMIHELKLSNQREQEQEILRKDLIANLSHDLRTPLTTIRAQLTHIKEEVKSKKGNEALEAINYKIDYVSTLIDNLLSYTLLSAKKYPYHPVKIELNRFVRKIVAQWYPLFEKQQVEIDLVTNPNFVEWNVDPLWLERILDNLLQNVIRHASEGKYVQIAIENHHTITIQDKGKGYTSKSNNQGAGIGLTIVDLMIQEMQLEWSIEKNELGTKVTITTNIK